jgi:hypothetical protein
MLYSKFPENRNHWLQGIDQVVGLHQLETSAM